MHGNVPNNYSYMSLLPGLVLSSISRNIGGQYSRNLKLLSSVAIIAFCALTSGNHSLNAPHLTWPLTIKQLLAPYFSLCSFHACCPISPDSTFTKCWSLLGSLLNLVTINCISLMNLEILNLNYTAWTVQVLIWN